MVKLEDIVSLGKRRGFIFPGSDVYGGFAGTWDFGPLGVMLKKNLMDLWWNFWVEKRDDIFGVDAAILMNPKTWVASGHTATFADPLVECKACHGRFRADKLVDGATESISTEEFLKKSPKCPTCGKTEWGPIRKFNMMFTTHVGAVLPEDATGSAEDKALLEKSVAYLAQKPRKGFLRTIETSSTHFIPLFLSVLPSRERRSETKSLRAILSFATANVPRWKSNILSTRKLGNLNSKKC